MTQRIPRALVGAFAIFALASCGSDSTGPGGVAAEATLPLQYLDIFGSTGTSLTDLGSDAMQFGGPNITLAPGATVRSAVAGLAAHLARFNGGATAQLVLSSPSCNPDQVGLATDTDADGIPDDGTITFTADNCTVFDTATGDAMLARGTYRIQDTNDDLYGFKVTISNLHIRDFTGSSGTFSDILYNATESANTQAASATYHLQLHGIISQGDNTGSQQQDATYDVVDTYHPNGSITAGDPFPNGTFTVAGTLDATLTDFGVSTRVVLKLVTPTPMSFTNACGAVNSGNYEMRVNGSTTEGLLIHYEACNGYFEPLGAGTF